MSDPLPGAPATPTKRPARDTAATLAAPLTILHAAACGSSGLSARALGAAMWSHATRFELIAGEPLGINDVLRVAMCPLFDSATPWATRRQGLVTCTLQGEDQAAWARAAARHCSSPGRTDASGDASPPDAGAAVHHNAHPSFTEGLMAIARQFGPQGHGVRNAVALMAVDSLLHGPHLEALHGQQLLSTEELAQGLIPSEACAWIAVAPFAATQEHTGRPVVRGACCVPLEPSAGPALVRAIRGAVGELTGPIHTVLWDIGPDAAFLPAIAEAISLLGPLVQTAQFVRPMQYIGGTGAAFVAVALVLAIEGCRAGTTAGGRTLVCSLTPQTASAVCIEAPWHLPIMLADAPEARP